MHAQRAQWMYMCTVGSTNSVTPLGARTRCGQAPPLLTTRASAWSVQRLHAAVVVFDLREVGVRSLIGTVSSRRDGDSSLHHSQSLFALTGQHPHARQLDTVFQGCCGKMFRAEIGNVLGARLLL